MRATAIPRIGLALVLTAWTTVMLSIAVSELL